MKNDDSSYDANELREDYIKRMLADGYAVVYPAPNELQIDIDSDAQFEAYLASWAIFKRDAIHVFCNDVSVRERPSRSGLPSRHITVTLPFDVTPEQRIMWQAALGSDPVRELLSAMRLARGDIHPTLFVEVA